MAAGGEMDESLIDKNDYDYVEPILEAPSNYFYLCVLISSMGAFLFGCGLGFTSPTLVANKAGKSSACPIINCDLPFHNSSYPMGVMSSSALTDAHHCVNAHKMNCELQFSEGFSSLFGSIINFGCLFGALAGGAFVDRFGKKMSMTVSNILYLIGWSLIAFVPTPDDGNVWDGVSSSAGNVLSIEVMLTASRLIIGFGVGIICCSVSNYQTEICTMEQRGAIGTVFQLFIVIGLFSVYLIGSVVAWRSLALLCVFGSIAAIVCTQFLVESPIWLLTKGKDKEAEAALRSLRAADVGSVEEQLAEMKDTVFEDGPDTRIEETSGGVSEILDDPNSRKALFIGVGLMFVQQLSGINAIMFYAGEIFNSVPGTTADMANDYSTGMQAMQVLITLSSAFFMDKVACIHCDSPHLIMMRPDEPGTLYPDV